MTDPRPGIASGVRMTVLTLESVIAAPLDVIGAPLGEEVTYGMEQPGHFLA